MQTVRYEVRYFEGSHYWEIIRVMPDGRETCVTTENDKLQALMTAEALNLMVLRSCPTKQRTYRDWRLQALIDAGK